MKVIPYGKQQIEPEDIEAVVRVLNQTLITQGPTVTEFESLFSTYLKNLSHSLDEIYSVAVSNGTAALHLCVLALGIKPGDRVLVTSNSFVASANCVLFAGADVEFVDISPSNHCIDLNLLETILENSEAGAYRGIISVDFAGYPVDLQRLRGIADRFGLWIIEDACHALGAVTKNSFGEVDVAGSGKYADLAVFSFHPVKHIATGEGGMITTRSKKLYEKLKLLRSHGITKDPTLMTQVDGGWDYEMQELGYNYRISDILCALGISQLKRIDQNIKHRRILAERYRKGLSALPIALPEDHHGHAYHLFVIQTNHRKALYEFLIEHGIYTQVHYIPIYAQPFYVKKYGKIEMENCDRYYSNCLSIPMYHSLTFDEQDYVIKKIELFYKDV